MKNDLIIMTFAQKDDARKALQTFDILRNGIDLGPETRCLVERDETGQISVHQIKLLPDSLRVESKVLEAFILALFGEEHEGALQLANAGLDAIFLNDVADALQPEKSALMIYIPRDRLVDTDRLVDALALMQGKIHHASFPNEVERAILSLEFTTTKPS